MTQSGSATIVESLLAQAERRPDHPAFTLIGRNGQEVEFGYAELLERSRECAAGLRDRGLSRGDRVLLCMPTDRELLAAIYGVLLAGGVCVPMYPPEMTRGIHRWKAQARAVCRVAQPRGAVVSGDSRVHLASVLAEHGEDLFAATPAELRGNGTAEPVDVLPADLAFLQFTSGTTRLPRGASISHAALMANVRALVAGLELEPSDVSVSWLPPYHDMGLVGHIFTPVEAAVRQVLMSPRDFVREPERWLRLITRFGATQTTSPNSGYSMCVRRVPRERRAGLDLSTLRWALNGAEQVMPATLSHFVRAYAPHGLRREALRPVYGLAEATLAVTFGPPGGPRVDWIDRARLAAEGRAVPASESSPAAQGFVSVGTPIPGIDLRLVRRRGRQPAAEREVGEVLVAGESLMDGYFNNPQATAEVREDGWLRTGDLGYLAGGELFITGRSKELVIKFGRNHFPQEFEAVCFDVPGLRAGRAVAFGLPNEGTGTEDLVLVAEVQRGRSTRDPELRAALERSVAEATQVKPDRVELLPAGTLPKTTSGKLQRAAVRAAFQEGRPLAAGSPSLPRELVDRVRSRVDLLRARIRQLLGWR